ERYPAPRSYYGSKRAASMMALSPCSSTMQDASAEASHRNARLYPMQSNAPTLHEYKIYRFYRRPLRNPLSSASMLIGQGFNIFYYDERRRRGGLQNRPFDLCAAIGFAA